MALMLIPGHDRDTLDHDSITARIDLDLDRLFTVPLGYTFIGGEPIDTAYEPDDTGCPLCIDGSACGALSSVPDCPMEARDRAQRLADAEPGMTAAEYRAEARASIREAKRRAVA